MITDYSFLFYILLPIVAFLYASVGHGGASGYLALMSLFSFAPEQMKSTALILNICVSAIALFYFLKNGHFNFRLFLILSIASVPFAFLGGTITIDDVLFKRILGGFLILAVLKLLGIFDKKTKEPESLKTPQLFITLMIGASIGFLSGLLGIGGGIILTPILLFLNWTTMKVAAGISAAFILVNSAAGLAGQISISTVVHENITLLILLTVAGGLLGGFFGSTKLNNRTLRYLLSVVLLIASVKLLLT